ncbi:MAG: hypothetical protein KAT16_07480 [Candidatus Heimdallarchaeota archaeon]|nr:hypothetical protein [Candidatus Heimdallarchaeota archaeon]
MDIEYQKKEVTWCLDRDGPRICLRAVAINDELQTLQISSESFSLDLKTTEAQEFLSILKNLTLSKEPTISLNKIISPDIVKEISDEIFDEKPSEISAISSSQATEYVKSTPSLDTKEILEVLQQPEISIDEKVEESSDISSPSSQPTESLEPSSTFDISDILEVFEKPELSIDNEVDESPNISSPSSQPSESLEPSPTLDTSEILDVLKQSEVQEEEKPVKIRRLGSLFEREEKVTLTPSPDTSQGTDVVKQPDGVLEDELTQLTDILVGREEPKKESFGIPAEQNETSNMIEGIFEEENVKPSEVLRERVDTASFFHQVEEKSPLEQLLDEDKEEGKSVSSVPPKSSEVQSPSGVDGVDHERKEIAPFTLDDLQSSSFISDFNSKKEENKSETKKIDSQVSDLQSSKDDSHQVDSLTERSYTTEADRKKQIEKEREARKKRLWELTRGF